MANRTAASEKLEARIPHDLADSVRQYARQHRCSVSDLIGKRWRCGWSTTP